MRIEHIEAIPVALPLAKPLMMGGQRYERSESLLIRIACNHGPDGWGEAAPSVPQGEQLAELVRQAQSLAAPMLAGAMVSHRAALVTRLLDELGCSPRVAAAIDIALADALGHAHGLRVADLHGGPTRESIGQKWLIGGASIEHDVAEAQRARAEGFVAFTLKVGSKPLEQDIKLARLLRGTLGAHVRLYADANGAWSLDQARQFLSATADLDLICLEQPLPAHEANSAAALLASAPTLLAVDEAVSTSADIIAALEARTAHGCVIKPSKFGGIARAIEAGLLCHALGLRVALATPVAESSIATAAALHVAAVLPKIDWEFAPSSDYLASDLVKLPIRHSEGRLLLPSGPGLGVNVDTGLVQKFRLDR